MDARRGRGDVLELQQPRSIRSGIATTPVSSSTSTMASGIARRAADVVDAGAAPAFVKEIEANVKKTGNVYGTKDETGPVDKADVLYIVDDTTRAKTPEIAEAMKKTAQGQRRQVCRAGEGHRWLGTVRPGLVGAGRGEGQGVRWLHQGQRCEDGGGQLPGRGVCAARVVSQDRAQARCEVLHHTEYLEKLGVAGKFKGKVTFHDPSYLGRFWVCSTRRATS